MTTWLPVPGYPGYEISSDGNVSSLDRIIYDPRWAKHRNYPGRILTPVKTKTGYLRVKLGGGHHGIGIHRLVAVAFIGPCPDGMQICHNDGDKTHNMVSNLRYGTPSDNAQDRIRHGHQVDKRGERHHGAKLTSKQVKAIRASDEPLKTLSMQYAISCQQISKIRLGQRWRHL